MFEKTKIQNLVLLTASIVFYGLYDFKYIFLLALCIAVTKLGGDLGCRALLRGKAGKKIYLAALVLNLLILVVFKYTGFILGNLNEVFRCSITIPDILLPVGLSFYIFQSTSYLLDLYCERIKPEKSIIDYALFVSFFPVITAGPIQKSREFLPQVKAKRNITFYRFQEALLTFLWGAFLKMALADRAAVFVNGVYADYQNQGGFTLALCALAYSLQIYADFAGYSYMSVAVASMFGFHLSDNFRQPYLAVNIADFWRRWHISLTSWFREYLYIPLGGNRKGARRKYMNLFIVFLVSGLWHGAAWHFVFWGLLHGVYQAVGNVTLPQREKLCERLQIKRNCAVYRLWQRICVYGLASVAWVFFRAESFADAVQYLVRMVTAWNPWVLFDQSLYSFGLSLKEWHIGIWAAGLLLVVSLLRERGKRASDILEQNMFCRWLVCSFLFFSVLIFGIYGPDYSASSFIYAGF